MSQALVWNLIKIPNCNCDLNSIPDTSQFLTALAKEPYGDIVVNFNYREDMTIIDHKTQSELTKNKFTPKQDRLEIVVIEDDSAVSATMALCLELSLKPYLKLKFFNNAEDAFHYILAHVDTIELVIMDNRLPGMTGMQLLSIIKKDVTLKHLRVILQSSDSEDALEPYGTKPDFYLQKPWTKRQMLNAIGEAIGMPTLHY